MKEDRQKTCEERIDKGLKDRMKDVREIVGAEDPVEELNEKALALSKYEVYKLEFSWGGPQDYFEFEYDPESKTLVRITYHFLDWFDGAERTIKENSEEWKLLEELFNLCILME